MRLLSWTRRATQSFCVESIMKSVRAGRRADLRIFHLRHPEESQTYNPIANYHAPTEIASRISEQLPSKGESAAFKSFAWRFINTIAVALDAMDRTPDFKLIYEYIEDIEPLVRAYHKHMHAALKTPNWTREIKMNARLINPKEKAKSLQSADRVTIAMIEFRKKHKIQDEIAKDLEFVLQYDPGLLFENHCVATATAAEAQVRQHFGAAVT